MVSAPAVEPVCDEWASSAITANRRPCSSFSVLISLISASKVWMVTITICFPPVSAAASSFDLDSPSARVIDFTTPAWRSNWPIASWSCLSSTVRSVTTTTVSNTFALPSSWSWESWWASHAIELVLPDPAEC